VLKYKTIEKFCGQITVILRKTMAKYKGTPTRLPINETNEPAKETPKGKRSFFKKIPLPSMPSLPSLPGSSSSGIISRIIDFVERIISGAWSLILYVYNALRTNMILLGGTIIAIIILSIVLLVVEFENVKTLAQFKPNITTKIYDKNGILISELFKQKREVVPIERVPQHLINAFIAMEDNDFYDHFGINPKGIVRAFFINISAGRIKQGGSTITQQTAKLLLTSRKRNIFRKIKEAFIAIMMEMKYSKKQILHLYLNQIFFGHGSYGVESAAKLYFKKHIWELNLAQCALLSTLPSAPNRLSPIRHTKRSMNRHKIALAKMVEMGFITVKEAENAYLEFWPTFLARISDLAPTINTWSNRLDRAPWFTEYIRRKIVKKYGKEMVYEKGLLVYTTLDIKKQESGQKILKAALDRQTRTSGSLGFRNDDFIMDNYAETIDLVSTIFDMPKFTRRGNRANYKFNKYIRENIIEELEGINYLIGINPVGKTIDEFKSSFSDDRHQQRVEGAIVSINPKTGYIEAMIGGSEFTPMNQLNRVMQSRRQPGSAIKPLLYSAGIESGKFSPASAILDSPIVYLDNEGGDWLPENYSNKYFGLIRLRNALAKSINIISIKVADTLGIDYARNFIAKLLKMNKKEMDRRIPRNFSIALGSISVSPYELTRAYAIIANGGRDVIPFSIRYIKDRNDKIIEHREKDVKAILKKKAKNGTIHIIRADTAQTMISMLHTVITKGTGRGAYPGRTSGGKTGTTNNWKDAWFVGFAPQLATGLWIGYDKLGLSLGIGQAGGAIAAPVWRRYMRAALKNEPAYGFPVYAGLISKEVCSRTGLLPSEDCNIKINEIFTAKNQPEKTCEICEKIENNVILPTKGPKDNIVKGQKRNILKNLKKDSGDDIKGDIGTDLLN